MKAAGRTYDLHNLAVQCIQEICCLACPPSDLPALCLAIVRLVYGAQVNLHTSTGTFQADDTVLWKEAVKWLRRTEFHKRLLDINNQLPVLNDAASWAYVNHVLGDCTPEDEQAVALIENMRRKSTFAEYMVALLLNVRAARDNLANQLAPEVLDLILRTEAKAPILRAAVQIKSSPTLRLLVAKHEVRWAELARNAIVADLAALQHLESHKQITGRGKDLLRSAIKRLSA